MINKSISENYFAYFKAVCHDLAPRAKTVMGAPNTLRPLKACSVPTSIGLASIRSHTACLAGVESEMLKSIFF